jgi:hypothetical protein
MVPSPKNGLANLNSHSSLKAVITYTCCENDIELSGRTYWDALNGFEVRANH